MPGLSACVIAFNESQRIEPCLRSLAWCDEVLVVDSHSDDGTREIAASMGARVLERDWPGYTEQKEFAIRAAAFDWVLCIDADERISPALRTEIEALRAAGFPDAAGWEMPRVTWYLGKWIRHGTWYPDWSLRLFDRRRAHWASHPAYSIHERVVVDGPVRRLGADLLHEPYRNLADHLRTIDAYTTAIADGLHSQGKRARLSDLVLRPAIAFLRFLVFERSFLDGWRGLLLAYLHAHYVRLKYAKLLVLDRSAVGAKPDYDRLAKM